MPRKKVAKKKKAVKRLPPVEAKWSKKSTVRTVAAAVHRFWPLLEKFHDLSPEDVVHDIVLKLQRIEPKFRADKSKWESYAYRTARCTILDISKVRGRQRVRDAKYMGVTEDAGTEMDMPQDDQPQLHGEVVDGEVVCSTADDGFTLFEFARSMFIGALRASRGDREKARKVAAGFVMMRTKYNAAQGRQLFSDRADLRIALDFGEQHLVPSLRWFEEAEAIVAEAARTIQQEGD